MEHLADHAGSMDEDQMTVYGKYNTEELGSMAGFDKGAEPFDVIHSWAQSHHADIDIFCWENFVDVPWYFRNTTDNSWPAETRGNAGATLLVDGYCIDPRKPTNMTIVSLVSYPGSSDPMDDPFNGQNPVAISKAEIAATWGTIDLQPDFKADMTEAFAGQEIQFNNLTIGGRWPYTEAMWDFNDDGDPEISITGSHGEVKAEVTWAYDTPGIFSVALGMKDKSRNIVWKRKSDYINIEPAPSVIWDLPIENMALIAPNPDLGRPFLNLPAACDELTVSDGAILWGIYYFDETTGKWLYFIPGFTGNTLIQLEPDEYYYVIVTAPCNLLIPQ
jgi:hypothetical protein